MATQLTLAQIGDLALDAAIQISSFMERRSGALDLPRELLSSLVATIDSPHPPGCVTPRLDLAYLPIYASAMEMGESPMPGSVADFQDEVASILHRFLDASKDDDAELLPKLRDFCVAVHAQALAERCDSINSAVTPFHNATSHH